MSFFSRAGMYIPKQQGRIEECDHGFCSCEFSNVQVNIDEFQNFEKREENIYMLVYVDPNGGIKEDRRSVIACHLSCRTA